MAPYNENFKDQDYWRLTLLFGKLQEETYYIGTGL
jgi:hypothetical protein